MTKRCRSGGGGVAQLVEAPG